MVAPTTDFSQHGAVAKYDTLHEHLTRQGCGTVSMSFDQISALVPGGLPPSAYNHQAWWANQTDGGHTHARAWLDAGYRTESLSLTARRVTFACHP